MKKQTIKKSINSVDIELMQIEKENIQLYKIIDKDGQKWLKVGSSKHIAYRIASDRARELRFRKAVLLMQKHNLKFKKGDIFKTTYQEAKFQTWEKVLSFNDETGEMRTTHSYDNGKSWGIKFKTVTNGERNTLAFVLGILNGSLIHVSKN